MRLWTKALGFAALFCTAVGLAGAQQPATGARPGNPGVDKNAGGKNAPRFDAARFVKDHDKNGDGKLSKDELPQQAQQEFTQIDTNKDGALTAEELQQHADRMARQRPQLVEILWYAVDIPEEPATTHELQTAYDQLRKLDKNGDGKIDENEVKQFREERKKQRMEHIFQALDKNKDGKISKDEARGLWADNFDQLDKNKDGVLDQQEVDAAFSQQAAGQPGQPGRPGQPGQPQK